MYLQRHKCCEEDKIEGHELIVLAVRDITRRQETCLDVAKGIKTKVREAFLVRFYEVNKSRILSVAHTIVILISDFAPYV